MAVFDTKAPKFMRMLMTDFAIDKSRAAAVMGNAGHESGGLVKLQELKPTVKGSRGGYGWFQWTGPRRRAYEAYCKRNDLDPAGDKANYAFLFLELTTTEAKAIEALKNAPDNIEAQVKAFEMAYERAGVKHYPSRNAFARRALAAFDKAGDKVVAQSPIETAPAPVRIEPRGWWATIKDAFRGKVAPIQTTPERERPGLIEGGDPVLYDQQKMLSDKGWTEVGKPDGAMGSRTIAAIRAFRTESGLPVKDTIDEKFSASLLASGQRQVSKVRTDATAKDLRESGNSQVSALDGLKKYSWLLALLGVGGAADDSGLLDKASGAVDQAQFVLGSIASAITTIIYIIQWIVTHWWLFLIFGVLWALYRIYMAITNIVINFRRGFLLRADK